MTSWTGVKHTASFTMEAYRVSQHVPVCPCLTHSLVAGCHPKRKAETVFAVPFSASLFFKHVRVGDRQKKDRERNNTWCRIMSKSSLKSLEMSEHGPFLKGISSK